jgi:YegS/Rv2252/BmrU family lipid kinase
VSTLLEFNTDCGRCLALVSAKAGNAAVHGEALDAFANAGGGIAKVECPDDLKAALELVQAKQHERVIVVGGDGSISCAINALKQAELDLELAIIPAGTGNDFARTLDLPIDDVQAAWTTALTGQPRPVDVVEVGGPRPRWFLNVVTGGFGGRQAAEAASDQKSALGKIAYWLAAAAQLGDMPEFDVQLKAGEHSLSIQCLGFWLANGRYTGGGFPVAPEAQVDDGKLNVVVVPSMSALDLIGAGLDLTLIGAERSDRVLTFCTADLVVSAKQPIPLSIDGDPENVTSLECHVLRHAFRIIAGNNVPAEGSGVAAVEK